MDLPTQLVADMVSYEHLPKACALARIIHEGRMHGHLSFFDGHLMTLCSVVASTPFDDFADKDAALCVAVLHEAIKSDSLRYGDLIAFDFPQSVIDAVKVFDYTDDFPSSKTIKAAARNPIAKIVMAADITCHMAAISEAHPLARRFRSALESLQSATPRG